MEKQKRENNNTKNKTKKNKNISSTQKTQNQMHNKTIFQSTFQQNNKKNTIFLLLKYTRLSPKLQLTQYTHIQWSKTVREKKKLWKDHKAKHWNWKVNQTIRKRIDETLKMLLFITSTRAHWIECYCYVISWFSLLSDNKAMVFNDEIDFICTYKAKYNENHDEQKKKYQQQHQNEGNALKKEKMRKK